MAVSYKGLTIKFGGDTTGLQDALKKVQSSARNTQSDLKEINKSLKFNPGNTELLQQKVWALNSAYEETKQKLDAYKQAMDQLEAKKKSGEQLTEQEQRQYDALQRSILQCENQIESYGDALKEATKEADASQTALYKLGQKVEDNQEKFEAAGDKMQTAGTAMIGVSTAIAGASLAAFNEVDSGMDAVVKATGATGEAAEALGESVSNVAMTVAGAGNEWETIGNTVGEVSTRLGLAGEELDKVTELFFQFSEITGVDSVQAVQNASMAMQAFGVDSSHTHEVLGVFAKVAQDSGVSVDSLMQSVITNGATFREMGLDIDDAAVMLGKFEQAGVPADQMLTGLKKAAANCAKEGKDLGTSLTDLTARLQDPATQAEATQEAIELFGSKAAMSFIDAAKSGRVSFSDLQQSLSDYGSVVGDTFDETVDGVDQLNVATKELQAAGAELGGMFSDMLGPIVHDFAGMVHNVTEAYKNLSPEQQELAAKAVIAVGAVGGLVTVFGKVLSAAGSIAAGLKALGGVVAGLKAGWAAFSAVLAANPIGLVVTAIAALVAGLTWFFTQTEMGKEVWQGFCDLLSGLWTGLQEDWAAFCGVLSREWESFQTFLGGIPEWWQGIVDYWTGAFAEFGGYMTEGWNKIKADFQAAWDAIVQGVTTTWTNITTTISTAWTNITTAVTTAIESVKKRISDTWTNIKTTTSNIWNGIKEVLSSVWNAITSLVSGRVDAVANYLSNKWSIIRDTAANVWNGIKETVGGAIDMLKAIVTGDFDAIASAADRIWNGVKDTIGSAINGARDLVGNAIDAIRSFFNFSFEWPHLALPHIEYDLISIPVLGTIPNPATLHVEWYAKGGAIEPNNPHLIGVGDSHEREWIEPESKLLSLVESAMRNVSAGNVSVEVNVNATITGRQSAYDVGQNIGRGISSVMKQRGHSYA